MDEDIRERRSRRRKFGERAIHKEGEGRIRPRECCGGEREMQPWCDSAHLRQPDRRNHPHCQSGGVSSGYGEWKEIEKVCVCVCVCKCASKCLGFKCDDCKSACRYRQWYRGCLCTNLHTFLSVFLKHLSSTSNHSYWMTYLGHNAAAFLDWINLPQWPIFFLISYTAWC